MKCFLRCVNTKSNKASLISSTTRQQLRKLSENRPLLLSIEGNIGAGKSTLIDALRLSHPELNFVNEPLGIWSQLKNDSGESLLEVFYRDRKRWSYTFQSCALLSRFENIEGTIRKKVRSKETDTPARRDIFITERCLDTDLNVFTKMLRHEGSIDQLEFDIYYRLFSHLKSTSTPLGGIIYVSTDPNNCLKRIAGRNRSGEDSISLEYLESLHKCQKDWISSCDLPILKNKDTGAISKDLSTFINKIIGVPEAAK